MSKSAIKKPHTEVLAELSKVMFHAYVGDNHEWKTIEYDVYDGPVFLLFNIGNEPGQYHFAFEDNYERWERVQKLFADAVKWNTPLSKLYFKYNGDARREVIKLCLEIYNYELRCS